MARTQTDYRGTCQFGMVLVLTMALTMGAEGQSVDPGRFFLHELLGQYGSGGGLDSGQLEKLIEAVQAVVRDGWQPKEEAEKTLRNKTTLADQHSICANLTVEQCLRTKCLDPAAIFSFHTLPSGSSANSSQVALLTPTVLYQLQNAECYRRAGAPASGGRRPKPTTAETWGYGLLAVTVVNVCAMLGMLFYPIMKTAFYRKVLTAMVGLAVGSLSASAILVLIPESLDLMGEDSHVAEVYLWRGLVVLAGIYLFFTVERALEAAVARKRKSTEVKEYEVRSKGLDNPAFDGEMNGTASNRHVNGNQNHSSSAGHGHSHLGGAADLPVKPMRWAPLSTIKPVAWMVVVGDALHNFVDGVGIGAAFSSDLLAGISLSLAVICEELPHELGDFAVLLSSGMGLCQALLVNLGSGVSCYLGLAVGIQVGTLDNGAFYIFALAAGMFLYIALVDMLPEMNEQAREAERESGSVCLVYVLQNLGLLAGWGIILLLVLYKDDISL